MCVSIHRYTQYIYSVFFFTLWKYLRFTEGLTCAKHFICIILLGSRKNSYYKTGTIILIILHMGEQRHREFLILGSFPWTYDYCVTGLGFEMPQELSCHRTSHTNRCLCVTDVTTPIMPRPTWQQSQPLPEFFCQVFPGFCDCRLAG